MKQYTILNIPKFLTLTLILFACEKDQPFGGPAKYHYNYYLKNETGQIVYVSTWFKDKVYLSKAEMKPKKDLFFTRESLQDAEEYFPPFITRIRFELENGKAMEQVCDTASGKIKVCPDTSTIYYPDNYEEKTRRVLFRDPPFVGEKDFYKRIYTLKQYQLSQFK